MIEVPISRSIVEEFLTTGKKIDLQEVTDGLPEGCDLIHAYLSYNDLVLVFREKGDEFSTTRKNIEVKRHNKEPFHA